MPINNSSTPAPLSVTQGELSGQGRLFQHLTTLPINNSSTPAPLSVTQGESSARVTSTPYAIIQSQTSNEESVTSATMPTTITTNIVSVSNTAFQSADLAEHSRSTSTSFHLNRHQPSRSSILVHPDEVVEKNINLKTPSKITKLALKLAKESFFGPETMAQCTVAGMRDLDGLPETELCSLKLYLFQLFPSFTKQEFEEIWKSCTNSIGQACKNMLADLETLDWTLILECIPRL